MLHSIGACWVVLVTGLMAQGPAGFENYREAWSRLLRTYGNARWTISVKHRGGIEETTVLFLRWPLVRVDVEVSDRRSGDGSSRGVARRFVYVYTPEVRFAAEQVAGRHVLTTWSSRRSAKTDIELWHTYTGEAPRLAPVIRGYLPLVPLVFYGEPLPRLFSGETGWQIVHCERRPRQAGEELVARLLQHNPRLGSARLTLRLDHDHQWLLKGWEWHPGAHTDQMRRCELRYDYDQMIDGLPVPTWGRPYVPAQDVVLWEARLLSLDATAPPETAFRPETFGISASQLRPGHGRLWVWALLGVLGLLTCLALARAAARRSSRKRATGQA